MWIISCLVLCVHLAIPDVTPGDSYLSKAEVADGQDSQVISASSKAAALNPIYADCSHSSQIQVYGKHKEGELSLVSEKTCDKTPPVSDNNGFGVREVFRFLSKPEVSQKTEDTHSSLVWSSVAISSTMSTYQTYNDDFIKTHTKLQTLSNRPKEVQTRPRFSVKATNSRSKSRILTLSLDPISTISLPTTPKSTDQTYSADFTDALNKLQTSSNKPKVVNTRPRFSVKAHNSNSKIPSLSLDPVPSQTHLLKHFFSSVLPNRVSVVRIGTREKNEIEKKNDRESDDTKPNKIYRMSINELPSPNQFSDLAHLEETDVTSDSSALLPLPSERDERLPQVYHMSLDQLKEPSSSLKYENVEVSTDYVTVSLPKLKQVKVNVMDKMENELRSMSNPSTLYELLPTPAPAGKTDKPLDPEKDTGFNHDSNPARDIISLSSKEKFEGNPEQKRPLSKTESSRKELVPFLSELGFPLSDKSCLNLNPLTTAMNNSSLLNKTCLKEDLSNPLKMFPGVPTSGVSPSGTPVEIHEDNTDSCISLVSSACSVSKREDDEVKVSPVRRVIRKSDPEEEESLVTARSAAAGLLAGIQTIYHAVSELFTVINPLYDVEEDAIHTDTEDSQDIDTDSEDSQDIDTDSEAIQNYYTATEAIQPVKDADRIRDNSKSQGFWKPFFCIVISLYLIFPIFRM